MDRDKTKRYDAVVVGVSAGGLAALSTLLPGLDAEFPAHVLVVQHLSAGSDDYMVRRLNELCALEVREAEDKDVPRRGCVYVAPPNYHLLVEPDGALALSIEPRVNFSRPSVDVLFETAAEAHGDRLVGVVLTGANNDGAKGLQRIKEYGGLCIVQSPETAQADAMPRAALQAVTPDAVLPLEAIAPLLNTLFLGEDAADA
jgi:two-component system chemotaxis response regulator CheB